MIQKKLVAQLADKDILIPLKEFSETHMSRSPKIVSVVPVPVGTKPYFNGVYIVRDELGNQKIFKPALDQRAIFEIPDHEVKNWVSFNREASAGDIIDENLGATGVANNEVQLFVPQAKEAILNHNGKYYGVGTVFEFVPNAVTLEAINQIPDLNKLMRSTEAWKLFEARVRTIDYALGNPDRFHNPGFSEIFHSENSTNLLLQLPGQLDLKNPERVKELVRKMRDPVTGAEFSEAWVKKIRAGLIDNSIGIPGDPRFDSRYLPSARLIPKDLQKAIVGFNDHAFRRAYSGLLPENGISDVISRVHDIQEIAKLSELPVQKFQILPVLTQRRLNREAYEYNLHLSRTAAYGVSIKKFDLAASDALALS